MDKLRMAGLTLVFLGIFAAFCGTGWDPANGLNASFWLMIGGVLSAFLGTACLFLTGDIA